MVLDVAGAPEMESRPSRESVLHLRAARVLVLSCHRDLMLVALL